MVGVASLATGSHQTRLNFLATAVLIRYTGFFLEGFNLWFRRSYAPLLNVIQRIIIERTEQI